MYTSVDTALFSLFSNFLVCFDIMCRCNKCINFLWSSAKADTNKLSEFAQGFTVGGSLIFKHTSLQNWNIKNKCERKGTSIT